jgi:hypothetical protein
MKKYMQLIFSTAIVVIVCTFLIVPFALSKTIDHLSSEKPVHTIEQCFKDNLNANVSSNENISGNTFAWYWNCQVGHFDSENNLNSGRDGVHLTSFHTGESDLHHRIYESRNTEKISISAIIAYGVMSLENNEPEWAFPSNEFSPSPVPEPATILLLGIGLIGLEEFRRKFKRIRKS